VPGVVSASSSAAAPSGAGPTNLILLTLGDYSINPLTLGLSWRDAAFEEHAQRTRTVLRIARGDVSLCIWRLLFLQTLHFDELDFDGIELFLLQDTAGRIAPFYTPDMTNATLIVALASATNRFTRHDANRTRMRKAAELHGVSVEDRAPTEVVVPDLLVTNATIICRARESDTHMWSLSNAYLALQDFSAPVLENDEPWQVACGAEIGGEPRRRLDLTARFLSQPAQPLLEICLTGTQVRLTGLWNSLSRTRRRADPATPVSPATNWFARCYSNEWRGFWLAFERERARLRDMPIVSNYLARGALETMLCDVSLHLSISNRAYLPGHVTLTFTRPAPRPDLLHIAYRITNSPSILELQRVAQ
jgi:hypothetical protein